jgi:hypothetical protein
MVLVLVMELFHPKHSSSTAVSAYTTSSSSYHLISLPYSSSSSSSVPSAQSIRDLWRWKDDILGNGHDFFTPRSRAIQTLISLFVGQTFAQQERPSSSSSSTKAVCWKIDECAILSNCARMDVYLVCSPSWNNTMDGANASTTTIGTTSASPKALVANILASQLEQYQKRRSYKTYIMDSISAILDMPNVIIPMEANSPASERLQRELNDNLQETLGPEEILRHTCLVACGLAPRPNRPNREVQFRPFSSRDAHILLQLKRTIDVANGPRIRRILQASLSAGKAARDGNVVPQILPLARAYYSSSDPGTTTTIDAAISAVFTLAIEPAVERCLYNLRAMESSTQISILRQKCERMVTDAGGNLEDIQRLHKLLHLPTIALREGKDIDEMDVLASVQTMLKERNKKVAKKGLST